MRTHITFKKACQAASYEVFQNAGNTVLPLNEQKTQRIELLRSVLPHRLYGELLHLCEGGCRIFEVRLRRGKTAFATVFDGRQRNLPLDFFCSDEDFYKIFNLLCEGSLYAYADSIKQGYITLDGGVRIGVCGHAATENGNVLGVSDISSLNIRLPFDEARIEQRTAEMLRREFKDGGGVLIWGRPADGKTTFLRSMVKSLAKGEAAMRLAVVDTRDELGRGMEDEELCVDILRGYGRGEGISLATAYLNPELIVCDEIGGEAEAIEILNAQNRGVPLLASAHSESISSLLKRRGICELHRAHVFSCYIGIRIDGCGGFKYTVTHWEEAECERVRGDAHYV